MMKLLLLGANGRTGREIVDQALGRGHEVVALVREPSSLTPREGLTIVVGTPMDACDVALALADCDAALVALNNQRKSDFPWSAPKSPTRHIETSVGNLAVAMTASGIKRLVVLSAMSVAESFADAPAILRFLVRFSNLGIAYAEHGATDTLLRMTDLDWTLVRPVGFSNASRPRTLIVGTATNPKPAMLISRATVARFMLDCVESSRYIRETPVISER